MNLNNLTKAELISKIDQLKNQSIVIEKSKISEKEKSITF